MVYLELELQTAKIVLIYKPKILHIISSIASTIKENLLSNGAQLKISQPKENEMGKIQQLEIESAFYIKKLEKWQ